MPKEEHLVRSLSTRAQIPKRELEMTQHSDEPVNLPIGAKELIIRSFDWIGGSRRGRRILLKTSELCQSSIGAGNYDDQFVRTGEKGLIAGLAKVCGSIFAVDIGAHHGTWTDLIIAQSPDNRVIALEPDPDSFAQLDQRVSKSPKILALNFAVGDSDGLASLYRDPHNSQLSTLLPQMLARVPESELELDGAAIKVQQRSLKAVLNIASESGFFENSESVNFIKMDTEGTEINIVSQVLTEIPTCPAVQFEFNSHSLAQGIFVDDFLRLFRDHNFELFRLSPRSLVPYADLSFSHANVAAFSNWVALHSRIAGDVADNFARP